MLNSSLRKDFPKNIYTAYKLLQTTAKVCIRSASDSRLQRGISQSGMTLQLWQDSLDRSIKDWKRGRQISERSVLLPSVCGDEKWEGGKVNMGHSSGLRHVLPSGWKRKWLGPLFSFLPLSFLFFFLLLYIWSHSWWDVPFWLARGLIQCLLLWPRFISRTLAGGKSWSQALLTDFL